MFIVVRGYDVIVIPNEFGKIAPQYTQNNEMMVLLKYIEVEIVHVSLTHDPFLHVRNEYYSHFGTERFTRNRINSLWPSDALWGHRSGSTLTQVLT